MAKILQMPTQKYNQREFDDMFKGFIQQVDKLAAAKDMNAVVGFPGNSAVLSEKEEK